MSSPPGDGNGDRAAEASSPATAPDTPTAAPVAEPPLWEDPHLPPAPRDTPTIKKGPELQHEHRLQMWVLVGLGGAFLATLVAVILGPGTHSISEDLAKTIAQTILPAILASAGTIVGTLFGNKK